MVVSLSRGSLVLVDESYDSRRGPCSPAFVVKGEKEGEAANRLSCRIGVGDNIVGVCVPGSDVEGKAINVGGLGKGDVRDPV